MNDAEAVERIRAWAHMKGGIDGLKIDDVEALLRRHDHFRDEATRKPFAILAISPDLTDADFERLRLRWKEFADGIF